MRRLLPSSSCRLGGRKPAAAWSRPRRFSIAPSFALTRDPARHAARALAAAQANVQAGAFDTALELAGHGGGGRATGSGP